MAHDSRLAGLMPALARVDGDATFHGVNTTYDLWTALEQVGGDLTFRGDMPEIIENLSALTTVGGDLVIEHATVSGDADDHRLEALQSVGGTLIFRAQHTLTDLYLGDPSSLEVGAVEIDQTASLSDLSVTHIHVADDGPITITDNALLPTPAAEAFVAAQIDQGWSGVATIAGNAP